MFVSFFFFFKQKTAYDIMPSLVGSEMCIRDRFFIHLESRKVDIAGITVHPNEQWMRQMARNVTMEGCATLRDCRYLLHDRDTKYTISFRAIIESGQVKTLLLPARSPNLNAYAERWVRSVKEEFEPPRDCRRLFCLSHAATAVSAIMA